MHVFSMQLGVSIRFAICLVQGLGTQKLNPETIFWLLLSRLAKGITIGIMNFHLAGKPQRISGG